MCGRYRASTRGAAVTNLLENRTVVIIRDCTAQQDNNPCREISYRAVTGDNFTALFFFPEEGQALLDEPVVTRLQDLETFILQ